jgi:hypothetical protein
LAREARLVDSDIVVVPEPRLQKSIRAADGATAPAKPADGQPRAAASPEALAALKAARASASVPDRATRDLGYWRAPHRRKAPWRLEFRGIRIAAELYSPPMNGTAGSSVRCPH